MHASEALVVTPCLLVDLLHVMKRLVWVSIKV